MTFEKQVLKSKKIAADACFFVYHFEGKKPYINLTKRLLILLKEKKISLVGSVFLLTELLPLPFKFESEELIALYQTLEETIRGFKFIPVDSKIAVLAAQLRASYKLRGPDAIHLATAIASQAQLFITNDEKLKKVKEIKVLVLKDFV